MTRDYINLGLEYLAGFRHDEGKRIVRDVYLAQLFRLGYALVLAERKRNEVLISGLSDIVDPALWGDKARNVVTGLLERKPLFYEGLAGDLADYRNFRSTADLALTADFMARLSARVHLISEIIDIPDEIRPWLIQNAKKHDWGLEHLFMTACVRGCISGQWKVAPLTTEDLARFYDILKETPEIGDRMVQEVGALVREMPESAEKNIEEASMTFVETTLTDFFENFMRITDRNNIDVRFIAGVITSTPA
jgi:hypothetical protein